MAAVAGRQPRQSVSTIGYPSLSSPSSSRISFTHRRPPQYVQLTAVECPVPRWLDVSVLLAASEGSLIGWYAILLRARLRPNGAWWHEGI